MKYTLQFGIAAWFRNIILKELKNLPFLFRFDETMTSQIKNDIKLLPFITRIILSRL